MSKRNTFFKQGLAIFIFFLPYFFLYCKHLVDLAEVRLVQDLEREHLKEHSLVSKRTHSTKVKRTAP